MDGYALKLKLEIQDKKFREILMRLQKARDELWDCLDELDRLGWLVGDQQFLEVEVAGQPEPEGVSDSRGWGTGSAGGMKGDGIG